MLASRRAEASTTEVNKHPLVQGTTSETDAKGGWRRRGPRLIGVLALVLPVVMLLAISQGTVAIAFEDVWRSLGALFANTPDQTATIVSQLRLPRTLLAALVGAVLAISGAAMQGLFRNPLADPSLIGVSAGASLGASLAIVVGSAGAMGLLGLTMVSAGAFLGGLLAVLLVYRVATRGPQTSVATMLLAGIAITALAGSLGNLLELQVSNEDLRRISLWRMGGLDGATWPRLLPMALVGVALLLALQRRHAALNALLLGESEARFLGIDVESTKRRLILWVALGVGVSVAMAGTIAFVGLVVPHMVRLATGPDHRYLLLASALAGGILLVVADTLARIVMAPAELPVGIVTALVGAPFFISLLRSSSRYGFGS